MENFKLTNEVSQTNKHDLAYGFDSSIQTGERTDFIHVFNSNEDECKRITALVLNAEELLDKVKKYFIDNWTEQETTDSIEIKELIKNAQP